MEEIPGFEKKEGNQKISKYLEESSTNKESLFVPQKIIEKYGMVMDLVTEHSERSCCFTKGYSRLIEGTGSILQTNLKINFQFGNEKNEKNEKKIEKNEKKIENNFLNEDSSHIISLLKDCQLRFFSPREISNLHCFPSHFVFPSEMSSKQVTRLLGNSLNVLVVSKIISYLFDKIKI